LTRGEFTVRRPIPNPVRLGFIGMDRVDGQGLAEVVNLDVTIDEQDGGDKPLWRNRRISELVFSPRAMPLHPNGCRAWTSPRSRGWFVNHDVARRFGWPVLDLGRQTLLRILLLPKGRRGGQLGETRGIVRVT